MGNRWPQRYLIHEPVSVYPCENPESFIEVIPKTDLQLGQILLEQFSNFTSLLDQFVPLDHLDSFVQEEQFRRISDPRIVDSVAFFDSEMFRVVVSTSQQLFRECDNIGRRGKIPMIMGPDISGSSSASLYLVHDEDDSVLFGNVAESLEEGWTTVMVASLGLNRLHDDGSHVVVLLFPLGYLLLNIFQTLLVLLCIIFFILIQRVFVTRESSNRPVESGNVYLKTFNF